MKSDDQTPNLQIDYQNNISFCDLPLRKRTHSNNNIGDENQSIRKLLKPSFDHQQELSRHKAVLATQILNLIASKQEPETNYTKNPIKQHTDFINIQLQDNQNPTSLRKDIVRLIKAYPQPLKFGNKLLQSPQRKAKSILLSYFVGGIYVSLNYCGQVRFKEEILTYEEIIKNKEIVDQSMSPYQGQDKFRKLVFCPSNATKQCWKFLTHNETRILLTAKFGLGKTFGYILFSLLSNLIIKHKLKYHDLPKQINFKPFKLVYFNINLEEKKDEISCLFRRQCYEVGERLQKQQNLTQFYQNTIITIKGQRLKDAYLKLGIKLILLVDNINVLTSAIRKFKSFSAIQTYKKNQKRFDQLSALEQKKIEQKIQQQMLDEFGATSSTTFINANKAYQKLSIIQGVIPQFQHIIYLTSQNIENSLLQKMKLHGSQNNYVISTKQIPSKHMAKSIKIKADTAEFIILQLQKRIFDSQDTNKKIKKKQRLLNFIAHSLLQHLLTCQIFISPLSISTSIYDAEQASKQISQNQQIKGTQNLSKQSESKLILWQTFKSLVALVAEESQQKIHSLTKILIDQLIHSEKQGLRVQIDKFMNTKYPAQIQRSRLILLLRTLLQAQLRIENSQLKKSQYYSVSVKYLSMRLYGYLIREDLLNHFDNELIYPNLPYSFSPDPEYVYCRFDETSIVEILNKKQKKDVLFNALLQSELNILDLVGDQNTNGTFTIKLLKTILSTQGTFFKCYDISQKICFQFEWMKSYKQTLYFKSIPKINQKNYANFMFMQSFKEKLSIIPQGKYLFVPSKQVSQNITNNEDRSHQTSKLIDFMIVSKGSLTIQITAIDVTIEKGSAAYIDKIKRFLKQFENFRDKYTCQLQLNNQNYRVSLRYIVLCPLTPLKQQTDNQFWQKQLNHNDSPLIYKTINQYEFSVKVKSKNKQEEQEVSTLLKYVRVCSLIKTYISNRNPKQKQNIQLELKLFQRIKQERFQY